MTRKAALPAKPRSRFRPRLILQPSARRTARHNTHAALRRFFVIADAWELSPLQQCRLLKIPSPMVLARYRLGQVSRLSANQHERVVLLISIHASLGGETRQDHAWAWVNQPSEAEPFEGDSPLYFMLEKGLPALRAVARMLVRLQQK